MAHNPFTGQPNEIGETYGAHFGTAAGFGLRMIGGGLAALVHAFCPSLFERTGSETLGTLHRQINKRNEKTNWERHPTI